jgi:lipoprotein-anchoring transpeptidase ErfK/SrfK
MKPSRRLVVTLDDQHLRVLEGGRCLRQFVVSSAANGMGFEIDSYRTPTGRFRICEKIGDGLPGGTIFRGRVPAGFWQPDDATQDDLILTRILRLDGLDADNANTLDRCIYIHGTNREDLLGIPASHGCIRLGNADMIELFAMVADGDLVEILPASGWRDPG